MNAAKLQSFRDINVKPAGVAGKEALGMRNARHTSMARLHRLQVPARGWTGADVPA